MERHGLDRSGPGQIQALGARECGGELLVSIKSVEILDYLRTG